MQDNPRGQSPETNSDALGESAEEDNFLKFMDSLKAANATHGTGSRLPALSFVSPTVNAWKTPRSGRSSAADPSTPIPKRCTASNSSPTTPREYVCVYSKNRFKHSSVNFTSTLDQAIVDNLFRASFHQESISKHAVTPPAYLFEFMNDSEGDQSPVTFIR